jgi:hypothetical protein
LPLQKNNIPFGIYMKTDMEQVIAVKTEAPLENYGLPDPRQWEKASSVAFCSDWRGEHADPKRETKVRLLWIPEYLFIRFDCRYREISVYDGYPRRRDELWLRDVAEVFIQPGTEEPSHYREFEISPNGDWLDLDISQGQKSHLDCNLARRVVVDPDAGAWTAELGIPVNCLTAAFNPEDTWKLNLFRIEGREPNRFYSAWRPTHTSRPNFHVPERFGELHFENR